MKKGRPFGTTKNRVKVPGTSISKVNATFIEDKQSEGYKKSKIYDLALDLLRKSKII